MLTDPPKELLFKEGLELCYPVSIWGKLSNGLLPPGTFQVLEKQGVAFYPLSNPALHIGSIGWIGRILAAEIVDVMSIDFIKIERPEKVVVLRVLNLVLDSAQIKQTSVQDAEFLCQSFLKSLEVSLFVAQQAGTVRMWRSPRLFVGGAKRLDLVGKGLLAPYTIRASIGFEQLLACEVAECQILYLPTMPYRYIPLAEANSVIVAEAHFKMILVDPEIRFNAVYSHSCLSCRLFSILLSPAQQ
jgi:hypothetical protein